MLLRATVRRAALPMTHCGPRSRPRCFSSSSSSSSSSTSPRFRTQCVPAISTFVAVITTGLAGWAIVLTLPPTPVPRTTDTPETTSKPQLCEKSKTDSSKATSRADAIAKRETGVTDSSPMRLRMEAMIRRKQQEIVAALEAVDGGKFLVDEWQRPGGGGGTSCVLQDSAVFEKAGVNISVVYGSLPPVAVRSMRANHKSIAAPSSPDGTVDFFAAGLSIVLHPRNPMAPTVHLNYRYFETLDGDEAAHQSGQQSGQSGQPRSWWFGGGTDLTPCYLFDEDAAHFHGAIKAACDRHDPAYYARFKAWCDRYFFLRHRDECRGVGGIFFDDLADRDPDRLLAFVTDCLSSFLPSYLPILEKRKDMPYTQEEKDWQQLRRGRYVEFNLIHDRGTQFGLNTPNSRIESILMSLPLTARWQYMHAPTPGSREAHLVHVLKHPREWV